MNNPALNVATEEDPRLRRLSTLLELESAARRCRSRAELALLMVNDSARLFPYQQCLLWLDHPLTGLQVEAASGLSQLERHAPALQWLQPLLQQWAAQPESAVVTRLGAESLQASPEEWQQWVLGEGLWCPLQDIDGARIGALWLCRSAEPWRDGELLLWQRLSEAYSHAWQALAPRARPWQQRLQRLHRRRYLILLVLALLTLWPVHQSVLAPAQVVARDPALVSAPMIGVIDRILVAPNTDVEAGTVLFTLEDTELRNQHELALHRLAVAQADYLRAAQKAFGDLHSKAEVAVLEARVAQQQAEVSYTAERLEQVSVRADRAGVVVFDDANDWIGRPVVTGERVMQLADIHDTWLEVWVPVDDAIDLEPGNRVRLFLNVDPLTPRQASIIQTSYEATESPDQILAYRIKARFDEQETLPRLGLKGTAKLYGERAPWIYQVLRRPLAAARRWLGW